MPFLPGISGNPKGRPKKQRGEQGTTVVPSSPGTHAHYRDIDPACLALPPEKQAEDLLQGAYYIAKRCELKLHRALDIDAKNLWDDIRACGTAADKLLIKVESGGLDLHVPAQLLDKFMLAIQLKAPSTGVVPNESAQVIEKVE